MSVAGGPAHPRTVEHTAHRGEDMLMRCLAQSSRGLHGTCSVGMVAASEHVVLLMHCQPRATVSCTFWALFNCGELAERCKAAGLPAPPSCPPKTRIEASAQACLARGLCWRGPCLPRQCSWVCEAESLAMPGLKA